MTTIPIKIRKLWREGHQADEIASRLKTDLTGVENVIALAEKRELASQGFTADQIASITGANTNDVVNATVRTHVDPQLVWAADRRRMNLSLPSKQLFVRMFAEHQAANTGQRKAIRARIILESTNLVRKYVAAHVSKREKKFEFDDLESTCTVAVIEEVDRLLAKATKHTNPGSMIIEIIRATIYDPDRDLHSRPTRFYRPQKRASDSEHDALILRLEQQGCSPNYIQSQIEAHGWDRPKVVEVEAPWPDENIRGSDGHFTGERAGFDPGACDQSCEDWHTLIELHEAGILSVNEFTLLDLRSQGFTMAECAQELNCHVATLTNWLAAIKTKILLHTDD